MRSTLLSQVPRDLNKRGLVSGVAIDIYNKAMQVCVCMRVCV
jgi:hypothetical protein